MRQLARHRQSTHAVEGEEEEGETRHRSRLMNGMSEPIEDEVASRSQARACVVACCVPFPLALLPWPNRLMAFSSSNCGSNSLSLELDERFGLCSSLARRSSSVAIWTSVCCVLARTLMLTASIARSTVELLGQPSVFLAVRRTCRWPGPFHRLLLRGRRFQKPQVAEDLVIALDVIKPLLLVG